MELRIMYEQVIKHSWLWYIVCVNVFTFVVFGIDKWKSTTPSARRIPEKTLWALSLIGGSIGALIGMRVFHHKTKKASFQAIFLLIFLIQIGGIFFLLSWMTRNGL